MKRFFLACLTVLVCLAPVQAQTPDAQAQIQTNLFVQRLQTKEGGFLSHTPDPKSKIAEKPTLRATSAAIRVFKYMNNSPVPNKEECTKFVASCFDKASGGFADMPAGKADVFSTAVGLMAVADLGMPPEPHYSACVKYLSEHVKSFEEIRIAVAGLERIHKDAPDKAAWTAEVLKLEVVPSKEEKSGYARLLASKVVTLLRLGHTIDKEKLPALLEGLRSGQRDNGGYGKDDAKADLETTYRVMRAFMMLKQKPASVPNLMNFIAKCRNEDGGYSVSPGQPSTVNGTYYAVIITEWMSATK